jgi:hypothetical protein
MLASICLRPKCVEVTLYDHFYVPTLLQDFKFPPTLRDFPDSVMYKLMCFTRDNHAVILC